MNNSDLPQVEVYELMKARYSRAIKGSYAAMFIVVLLLVLVHLVMGISVDSLIKVGMTLTMVAFAVGVISTGYNLQVHCPHCQRMTRFKMLASSKQVLKLTCSECSTAFMSDCYFPYSGAWPEKRQ